MLLYHAVALTPSAIQAWVAKAEDENIDTLTKSVLKAVLFVAVIIYLNQYMQ